MIHFCYVHNNRLLCVLHCFVSFIYNDDKTNQSAEFQIVCTVTESHRYLNGAFSYGDYLFIPYAHEVSLLCINKKIPHNTMASTALWAVWYVTCCQQIWSPTSCSLQNLWTTILSTLVYQQTGRRVMELKLFKNTVQTTFLCYEK